MGKNKELSIVFSKQEAVYFPGESVSGEVYAELTANAKLKNIYLDIHGSAEVDWTDADEYRYRKSQIYLYQRVILFNEDGGSTHNKGEQFQYSFQFNLPLNLPSSLESHVKGGHGRIRYSLKAVMTKIWPAHDNKVNRPFTVISHVDLNALPRAKVSQQSRGQKVMKKLFRTNELLTAAIQTDKTGYVPGEFIRITGEINNQSSCKIKSWSIELLMDTSYYGFMHYEGLECCRWQHPHRSKTMNAKFDVVSKLKGGGLEAHKTHLLGAQNLYIPPLPPSVLPNCDFIIIKYSVVLKVHPGWTSGHILYVPVNIMIGTIPLTQMEYVYSRRPSAFCACERPALSVTILPPQSVSDPEDPEEPFVYTNASPPPKYEECVFDRVDIQDGDIDGDTPWSPVYPHYACPEYSAEDSGIAGRSPCPEYSTVDTAGVSRCSARSNTATSEYSVENTCGRFEFPTEGRDSPDIVENTI